MKKLITFSVCAMVTVFTVIASQKNSDAAQACGIGELVQRHLSENFDFSEENIAVLRDEIRQKQNSAFHLKPRSESRRFAARNRAESLRASRNLEGMYLLDSVVVVEDFKLTFTYDESGNAITEYGYSWVNNAWLNYGRTYITFDERGNEIHWVAYELNRTTNEWEGDLKLITAFNQNDSIIMHSSYRWCFENNTWAGFLKREFDFDENGNRTSRVNFSWTDNRWVYSSRDLAAFNENGNTLMSAIYDWNSETNQWVPWTKRLYEFHEMCADRLIKREIKRWDEENSIWEITSREIYEHDEAGNEISAIQYSFDWFAGELRVNRKTISEFDEHRNRIKFADYWWSSWEDAWMGSSKNRFGFDANGNELILRIIYTWNWDDNVWRENRKYKWEFDANGNEWLHTVSRWDMWENEWEYDSKQRHEFDERGNNILNVEYNWNREDNLWVEWLKIRRIFDANNNQIEFANYMWYAAGNIWRGTFKTVELRDERGGIIRRASYIWDFDNNVWEQSANVDYRREYAFDTDGNLIMHAVYVHNPDDDVWVGVVKDMFAYDANGNRTAVIWYDWDWDNDVWFRVLKQERFLDLTVCISSVVSAFDHGGDFSNKLLGIHTYELTSEGLVRTRTQRFYYTEVSPGTVDTPSVPAQNHIVIFPNPVTDSFSIAGIEESTPVSILDLNGRVVLQQTVSPNEHIVITHLPQGTYFVRVNDNVTKIIKR